MSEPIEYKSDVPPLQQAKTLMDMLTAGLGLELLDEHWQLTVTGAEQVMESSFRILEGLFDAAGEEKTVKEQASSDGIAIVTLFALLGAGSMTYMLSQQDCDHGIRVADCGICTRVKRFDVQNPNDEMKWGDR